MKSSSRTILPGSTLGVLGGGQLGRMTLYWLAGGWATGSTSTNPGTQLRRCSRSRTKRAFRSAWTDEAALGE